MDKIPVVFQSFFNKIADFYLIGLKNIFLKIHLKKYLTISICVETIFVKIELIKIFINKEKCSNQLMKLQYSISQ